MHNNNNKRSVLKLIAYGLLLSGVVYGVANMAGTTKDGIQMSEIKPLGLALSDELTEEQATQTESTSLALDILPDEDRGAVRSSSGYKLVASAITAELRQSRPTYALKILETDPLAKKLKTSEFDRIKAMIAQSYLIEGKIGKAGQIAGQAVARSGKFVPLAAWVAGQAAWRQGDYQKAARMFSVAGESQLASAWLASGGAYWAARAHTRAGNEELAVKYYEIASKHPRTFYGLISLKTLGKDFNFNWDHPELSHDTKRQLEQDMKISAALRLSREGRLSAAITTLSSTKWMKSDEGRRSLLAYFQVKKDPALTLFLARKTRDTNGRFFDTALYPVSPWEPKAGYEVDKALIHALIRQESRFNPHAVSRTGATGLMQIMPATAQYVSAGNAGSLSHPETNMAVGQKYVKYLLKDKSVNNDLFRMAVAYNAGPGNLSRWTKELSDIDDPMLFIESIPSGETRAFVERVMVNYWIYSLRMGQDTPSLDQVAMLDVPAAIRTTRTASLSLQQFAMAQ